MCTLKGCLLHSDTTKENMLCFLNFKTGQTSVSHCQIKSPCPKVSLGSFSANDPLNHV